MKLSAWFGCSSWLPQYNREWLASDLVAAVVVTIMLIPQSLAYALLAGLPAQVGLYASMAPLLAYAVFGSSRAMAVGPVAVASLMSAAAAGQFAQGNVELFYQASVVLAFIGGGVLIVLGLLRAGFVANLLSHPVVGGFVSASALLIAVGQLGSVLGVSAKGETFFQTVMALLKNFAQFDVATALIGALALLWLWAARKWGKNVLKGFGLKGLTLEIVFRAAPVLAIVMSIVAVSLLQLGTVRTVGAIPTDLPDLFFPSLELSRWVELFVPAVLIALVGFVETVSVGHALAAKRKQRIDPNQELLGLGAANIASGVFGGYSVTGGFSRSVVNFDAGAQTPMAGVFTAGGILLATLFLTPLLTNLPHATLAATIIIAVLGLIDRHLPGMLWRYSKRDFLAYLLTVIVVLVAGVEAGIIAGVVFSILALLAAISKPHMAVVGQVPGTEHFRNEKRHKVTMVDGVVSVRVDESLYFPNARWLEDALLEVATQKPDTKTMVLQCNAINHIDASALESLEKIDENLQAMGITLYLSEVKGPVQDQLLNSHWYATIKNRIGLTHLETVERARRGL
ncbi:SulP family inorganic anion transporter [Limnobacter sp. MED105]|uniref:SulP family inorganic anion transporter n=1 Tax=Limnobacter sp. MED105 TaxID=391597 RepID=UPI000156CA8A|nr:sulfate permease [Limnobacter sp. MED105]EDM83225.1 Sulfate transporter 1.3 [Limnobacter sp. MED105]